MSKYIYLNETTKEEVQDAIDDQLDIISQVMSEMLSDDENDTTRLLCMYLEGTPEERAIMDEVLVCLCGECMSSIINHAEKLIIYLKNNLTDFVRKASLCVVSFFYFRI